MMQNSYWYALQVKGGSEMELADAMNIELKNVLAFCPTYKTSVKHRNKKAKPEIVERPIFYGWVFVTFIRLDWQSVLSYHRDVIGFLSVGETPLPIRDKVIQEIESEASSGVYNPKVVGANWKDGDLVTIRDESSPFYGHSGSYVKMVNSKNSLITVVLFKHDTPVTVPTKLLEKIFRKEKQI